MRFSARCRSVSAVLRFEQLEDRTTPSATLAGVNVVMAAPTESAADEAALAAAPFAAQVDYLGFGIYRVALAAGTNVASAVSYYSTKPNVVSASPDSTIHVQSIPNDPSYSSLYALAKISAPTAWNTTTGSSNFVVAEIDTGVDYTDPDLAANIWTNPGEIVGNGLDDDHDGYVDDVHGWNFVANNNNVMDDNGHGTHVAGIMGAVGDNKLGVVGVDWSVKIMPLKFLDAHGSGSTSNAIRAMNYAVMMGAKVINNSWGGGPPSPALAAAIAGARAVGDIVVVAAGNDGANLDKTKEYPASYTTAYNNVVSVAATDSNDELASFSNYGLNSVTLAAPGVDILSTTPNDTYSVFSGTSMATPYVSGAIALFWSAHPTWTYLQVIAQLKSSTDFVPDLFGKVQTAGRLDVGAMFAGTTIPLTSARGPVVLSSVFSGSTSTSLQKVRFTFDRPVNAVSFTSADIVSFTGPNGAIHTSFAVVPVAGSGSKQFDVMFLTQTTPGGYTMVIGPNIRDFGGHKMNQNGNGIAGEAIQDRYTSAALLVVPATSAVAASGPPEPIEDFSTTTSTIVVPQGILISDMNVTVSLDHTRDSDLTIWLRSPTGQTIVLFARRGGSGANLTDSVFDDESGVAIGSPSAVAPFAGSFRPEEPLATFDGTSAAGTWTLGVADSVRLNTGMLTAWSLSISGSVGESAQKVESMGFQVGPAIPGWALADFVPPAVSSDRQRELQVSEEHLWRSERFGTRIFLAEPKAGMLLANYIPQEWKDLGLGDPDTEPVEIG